MFKDEGKQSEILFFFQFQSDAKQIRWWGKRWQKWRNYEREQGRKHGRTGWVGGRGSDAENFLVACTLLYTPLVRPSVCWLVGLSNHHTFYQFYFFKSFMSIPSHSKSICKFRTRLTGVGLVHSGVRVKGSMQTFVSDIDLMVSWFICFYTT